MYGFEMSGVGLFRCWFRLYCCL